jgi:Raf kinase inhibitor-like YbhB/YbcL family protein
MYYLITFIIYMLNATLTVSSPDFKAGGMIPTQFSCEGDNTSPALHIEGLPSSAKSLAIIVHDPDAPMKGGVTHWIAWNIEPMKDFPHKYNGGVEGLNTRQKEGYMGPCPPSGTHHYHFVVYALDSKLSVDKKSTEDELKKAMDGHILAHGEIIGLYKKMK